jgi:GTP cyclohydrolase II
MTTIGQAVERRSAAHDPEPGQALPDAASLALRAVHRAASDLRRGTPVLLTGPGGPLIIAAAETVGARGLAELSALATGPAVLLLATTRAAAVLHRPVPSQGASPAGTVRGVEPKGLREAPVALSLPPALLDPAHLRSLADPVADQLLPATPELTAPPPLAFAAIALAKLGRLLPALVAAPVAIHGAATTGALPRQEAATALLSLPAADILAYPATAAATLTRVAEAQVPLEDSSQTRIVAFRAADGGIEHLAILVGDPEGLFAAGGAPLVRVHSECFTGDLLGSLRCDCGPQLRGAIARMAKDGAGVLLYLAQEGRGIGLVNKLRAYTLQDQGLDTLDANRALGYGADERGFMVAATMLRQLGITRVRLLTNNPDKLAGLAACGIDVEGREPHSFAANGVNDHYLETKAERFGHML